MPGFLRVGFVLALLFPVVTGALAQDRTAPPLAAAQEGGIISNEEQSEFDARLRAATNDQERARIAAERDELIQVRIRRQGVEIPPSPRELDPDPIMPDVPTPPLDRPRPAGTLPGGALSGTGAGTSPAINPGGLGTEGR